MTLLQKLRLSKPQANTNGQPDRMRQFAFLHDQVPIPIAYVTPFLRYGYVNKCYADRFEVKPENIIGTSVESILGQEAFKKIRPRMEKALRGEQVVYEDEILLRGELRMIEAIYTPDFDSEGKVLGYVAVIKDTTDKKNAEAELRRKKEELEDYVDNGPIGLHWVDGNGIILWANKAEMNLLGYQAEEYIGHHISEFHADEEVCREILQRLSNNETLLQYEAELKRRDGSIRNVLINSNVYRENGEFVHTRCFTVDITERKRLEDIIHKNEENFRKVFQQAPISIIIYSGPDFTIEFINDVALEVTGEERKNMLHKPVFELYPELEEQGFKGLLTEIYTQGKKFADKERKVNFHRKGEQTYGWFDMILEPLRDNNGEITGIISMNVDITEQVESRKKIEEREAYYKELINALPVAVYTCDKEGNIQLYNREAVEIWGAEPGHHKWIGWEKVYTDGKELQPEESPMATSIKTGKPVKVDEIVVERADGSKRTLLPYPHPLFDSSGKVAGGVNVLIDITERKQMEQAFRESERNYRNLVHGLQVAIYTTDSEGRITLFNKSAAELWGREPETGKDLWCGSWKIYHTDGVTPMDLDSCPMAICLKEKRKITGEQIIIEKPAGERRMVEVHPEPIFDSMGQMIGAVNMLIDITERKQAEEKMARLAAIVSSSDDAIVSKTLKSIVTSWNPAAERLFGYKAEEMIGQSILKIIPEDRINEETEILERIERGEKIEQYETKRIRKNGELIDLSLSISPIRDPKGQIIGVSKIARDITHEKLLNKTLLENEERLRMASESTGLGAWEFNPVNRKMIWSDQCFAIYGLPSDTQLDAESIRKMNVPEDEPVIDEELRKALDPKGHGNFHLEYRIRRASDQETRWIKALGKMYFNESGEPDRLIGTMLDITEEKEKEKELIESVELFRTMADNVPAMIRMAGSDRFEDFFNQTWLSYRGRSREEESNSAWLDGLHPDDKQKCIDAFSNSYSTRQPFYLEYRLMRHDGQYRWIADSSVPRISNNEFIGFISACMDIDDQKNFREKLLASELLFKTISNAAPVGLWMAAPNGQCTFVNDTWVKWTGIPFQKQLEEGWIEALYDEDKASVPQRFIEAVEKEEKFIAEFRIVGHNEEPRWCLTEGFPYYYANGQLAGYAGSVTDISDLKKMEQRKDDFIKMASHELKTPITSINGYVQLLLNIYNERSERNMEIPKSTVKSSLQTIARQVAKLTRLISELLDLSRIESGRLELNKSEFRLEELVEEAVQEARLTTSRHAILFNGDFDRKILADKDRMAQVLSNLLNNAIKYSPHADKVEVMLEGDRKNARICIRDYGIGIEPKDQQKIFERFYRVEGKEEQTFPGFGIGLFIASEIVHRHGGQIMVNSSKGRGSQFTVVLPIEKGQTNH